ncbi:pentatricopeptide repeat-containing protein At2g22410, mitochondrial-like [Diospyros lotus]|uniref:pentatricopeptide repeat-containing protein At2g22410, mitochondrial-like n=1 Tax=Diospyros lotus TaxID=55363 RepID=UPI00225A4879|nr:pentatricopeptide repeat-containing protein At2g22410, mitochondrial-like [Diospyros lotus]
MSSVAVCLSLLLVLVQYGKEMNGKSLEILVQRCRKSLASLKQIHGQAIALGLLNQHQTLACRLLDAYSKLGHPLLAHSVFFTHIRNPDVVSFTCLISLYLQLQLPANAFSVFSHLVLSGVKPDGFSMVAALSACGRMADLGCGKIVHSMVLRFGFWGSEPILGNALIDMYSRNGRILSARMVFEGMEVKDVASWTSLLNGYVMCDDLDSAFQVFDRMPQRSSISWTAMIAGYVRGKTPIRALQLFQQMIRAQGGGEEECPNAITIVAVLSGCADIGALDLGRSIHSYAYKTNLIWNVALNNALVDLYSKSGTLKLAVKIFDEITEKDVFSWTAMISGLALHGEGRHALELFTNMLESGHIPNEVTFVSVLSACSHAGLVVEGQSLFNKLIQCYDLEAKMEHYGCMVDLLGRAGLLDEAAKFIKGMPFKPDAVIWRSLLSACLGQGNVKLAEMAGKKILELEPDDDGVYMLLWNVYWSENRLEDAMKARKMMRDQKIKKRPGCSWIEVNGVVQKFLADSTVLQVDAEMCTLLEIINNQSKTEGDHFSFE